MQNQKENNTLDEIRKRLDAILMLLMRKEFRNDEGKPNIGDAARFLHGIGFQPTEIAPLIGKEKATQVSPHLYTKQGRK